MFDFLERIMMFMMAPDGGDAGSGATTPQDTSTPPADATPADTAKPAGQDTPPANPPADQQAKPALPKYSSQLSPTKRESEEYQKYLYKHAGLDELADDYVSLSKRLEKAIEVPGKDAKPEDIKAFLGKLGVPEKADDYDLEIKGLEEGQAPEALKKTMREQFMKAGLTKAQAKGVWQGFVQNYINGRAYMEQQRSQQAQTFDARLAATLDKTYTAKSERDAAMKETATLFKQHIQRTGLGQVYKQTGLLYNTDFVLKMAAEEKARSGSSFVQGQPGGKQEPSYGTFGSGYSPEFIREMGKK